MSDVRVKLSLRGLNQLMTSALVQAVVDRVGERMASAAGEGFTYTARPHKYTARGYVEAKTMRARRREARDKVLTRAVSTARE